MSDDSDIRRHLVCYERVEGGCLTSTGNFVTNTNGPLTVEKYVAFLEEWKRDFPGFILTSLYTFEK